MKNQIKSIALIVLTTVLFIACSEDDDYGNNAPQPTETRLNVIAKGTSVAQVKTLIHPRTGESFEAFCFLMDLVDANTGAILGTVEDCDIGTTEEPDGSLISRVITTFNFDGRGSITSENIVLQKPIGDNKFTTEFTPTENNIIDGTFDFEGAQGTTTLNGEVDLSFFDSNIIIFNCGFDIKLVTSN